MSNLLNDKELYVMLGSLKMLLEKNNAAKAINLIEDTMAIIDGRKRFEKEFEEDTDDSGR